MYRPKGVAWSKSVASSYLRNLFYLQIVGISRLLKYLYLSHILVWTLVTVICWPFLMVVMRSPHTSWVNIWEETILSSLPPLLLILPSPSILNQLAWSLARERVSSSTMWVRDQIFKSSYWQPWAWHIPLLDIVASLDLTKLIF